MDNVSLLSSCEVEVGQIFLHIDSVGTRVGDCEMASLRSPVRTKSEK
jgi:hypothetical protein